MTSKKSNKIEYIKQNIMPMMNYQQIDQFIHYFFNNDFTQKEMKQIDTLVKEKHFSNLQYYKEKKIFNTESQFIFIPKYIFYAKEVRNNHAKSTKIETIEKSTIKKVKKDFLFYLSSSFILNIGNISLNDPENEIIKEITNLDKKSKIAIKSFFLDSIGCSVNRITSNHLKSLSWLLDNKIISVNDFCHNKTLSFLAADLETLKFLKEYGANFSLTNISNEICTFYNKDKACLQFLISEGCDINHLDNYNKNIAFNALRENYIDIKNLVQLGLNIHQIDNHHYSLLNYSTSIEQANYLLQNNVNANANDSFFLNKEVYELVKTYQEKELLKNKINNMSPNKLKM